MQNSSEYTTIGHPDRIADLISEAVLTACLKQNPWMRVHIQTSIFNNQVVLYGKLSEELNFDIQDFIINIIANCSEYDFRKAKIDTNFLYVDKEFAETQKSLKVGQKIQTTDQGIVFGFASDETKNHMPLAFELSRLFAKKLDLCRTNKILPYLRGDGKTLVILNDSEELSLKHLTLASHIHHAIDNDRVYSDFNEHILIPICKETGIHFVDDFYCDTFLRGGPDVSVGFSGKKIVVDNYGPSIPVGGGSFAGKCPTRFDKSGALFARFIAKNIIAAGLARQCLIKLTYCHSATMASDISVDCFETEKVPLEDLAEKINKKYNWSLCQMIETFNLRNLDYYQICKNGYFGNINHPWEVIDKQFLK
jgi:S-adenosylmethionine synthetase